MPPDVVRRLIPIHGIISWLDAVLLVVVVVSLFRKNGPDKPYFRPLVILASLGAIASFATGLGLELHYRMAMRQKLFIASKTMGWLFERKLHLSFGVFAFSLAGLLMLALARQNRRYLQPMRAGYLFSAAFALTICVISSLIARTIPLAP